MVRRAIGTALTVIALATAAVLGMTRAALAASLPDGPTVPWPQTTGPRVRSVEVNGGFIWIGGDFDSFTDSAGVTRSDVENLAVFRATDGRWAPFAIPRLTGGQVWDMDVRGNGVVLAGKFTDDGNSARKNLVVVDAAGGTKWFGKAPVGKAVLTTSSRIYSAGRKISAWTYDGSKVFGGKTRVVVDDTLRGHKTSPAYRDLLWLGGAIYAACQCDHLDSLSGTPVKALIRLDADGNHDPSFDLSTAFGRGLRSAATGLSVATDGSVLYLGAGGSDFLARIDQQGKVQWLRDTSGSAQTVQVHDGRVLIGGHFWEVADAAGDSCGFRSSNNSVTLDPDDECQTRRGLAEYSFSGVLGPWGPTLAGRYNLAWDIEPEGDLVHVGGQFTKVEGQRRGSYTRLE